MKKLLLAVLFSAFALGATAGGKDDVVMEQPAEPQMVEEEVQPAEDTGGLAILGILIALVLAAAAGS
ncbi:MAG: hypothetical protein OXB95_07900 [Rhodobacteraceae bacterium]|nr:hypothetical protein [Paracoccaceae bacterium]